MSIYAFLSLVPFQFRSIGWVADQLFRFDRVKKLAAMVELCDKKIQGMSVSLASLLAC